MRNILMSDTKKRPNFLFLTASLIACACIGWGATAWLADRDSKTLAAQTKPNSAVANSNTPVPGASAPLAPTSVAPSVVPAQQTKAALAAQTHAVITKPEAPSNSASLQGSPAPALYQGGHVIGTTPTQASAVVARVDSVPGQSTARPTAPTPTIVPAPIANRQMARQVIPPTLTAAQKATTQLPTPDVAAPAVKARPDQIAQTVVVTAARSPFVGGQNIDSIGRGNRVTITLPTRTDKKRDIRR